MSIFKETILELGFSVTEKANLKVVDQYPVENAIAYSKSFSRNSSQKSSMVSSWYLQKVFSWDYFRYPSRNISGVPPGSNNFQQKFLTNVFWVAVNDSPRGSVRNCSRELFTDFSQDYSQDSFPGIPFVFFLFGILILVLSGYSFWIPFRIVSGILSRIHLGFFLDFRWEILSKLVNWYLPRFLWDYSRHFLSDIFRISI